MYFTGKIYQLSLAYQQSANEEAVFLFSLVYNQVITLIILIGAQKGIKHSMISPRNKGMNRSLVYDFARFNKHHLDVLMVLNEDNQHQLDNWQLGWKLKCQNRDKGLTPE